ncbi:hypothetical protein ACP4OV_023677 [Aristida adscensionis]
MGNSYSGGGSSAAAGPEVPAHLCFFLLVLLLFLGVSWYASYESAAESLATQARVLLMASPFALLIAVRLLSSAGGGGAGEGRRLEDLLAVPMPERDSIHRAGGSPWGVGLLLLLLLVMVSYQSNFREKWFPLAGR